MSNITKAIIVLALVATVGASRHADIFGMRKLRDDAASTEHFSFFNQKYLNDILDAAAATKLST